MNSTQIVYEKVTNIIIDRLNAGVIPWRKPWAAKGGANTPRNFISRKPYRGINLWLLAGAYATPFWLTFNQAKAIGAKVRKGEKGSTVVFWSILDDKKAKVKDGEKRKKFYFLRYFTVFNVEQCEGIDEAKLAKVRAEFDASKPAVFNAEEAAEAIIAGYADKPRTEFGGDRACYSPALDRVCLPLATDFESPNAFYSVAFHEYAHSTGHAKRLNRDTLVKNDGFGGETYSKEELVAEFCATFLLAQCDLEQPTLENSVAYIQNWKAKLKDDPKLIVSAASQAQRAADYILGLVKPEGEGEEATPSESEELEAANA